jgi:hypothetical protein
MLLPSPTVERKVNRVESMSGHLVRRSFSESRTREICQSGSMSGCSDASWRSSGERPARENCPVVSVVISGGGAGDQTVESPEGQPRNEPSHGNRSVGDRKCRDLPLRSKASVIGEGTGCQQPRNIPGSQRTTCRHRTTSESTEPLVGCLGVSSSRPTPSDGNRYKPLSDEIRLCPVAEKIRPTEF